MPPCTIRTIRREKSNEVNREPVAEITSRLTEPSFAADDSSASGEATRMA
jgi:hypothetical protein